MASLRGQDVPQHLVAELEICRRPNLRHIEPVREEVFRANIDGLAESYFGLELLDVLNHAVDDNQKV